GQTNCERKAFALVAFNGHFAAVFADDPTHDQQTESRTGALGRKIRVEDPAQTFRGHSAAGVGETDIHVRRIHARADAENAAALHRFEAVLDDVVKGLLHLI